MKIVYQKPKGITLRDIILIKVYIFGSHVMRHSKNSIFSEEELDVEVKHYQFLRKYGLL